MTSLTDRTERALLGALLTHPGAPALSYLQTTDFASRQRGEVLAGIRAAHTAGHRPGNRWLDSVVAATGTVMTARQLQDLQADCPEPRHVNAYAGLVIEARVRRIIAGVADRITLDSGAFDFDAQRLAAIRAPSAGLAATMTRHMDALAAAFKVHTEFDPGTWQPISLGERPPLPGVIPASAPAQAWQPAQWRDQPGPRARAEERVLAGLLQRHIDTPQVIAVLTPGMFTSPLRKTIYQTIQILHLHDQPVDDITAEWALARRLTNGSAAEPVPFSRAETGPGYLTQLARTQIGPAGMTVGAMELAEKTAPAAITRPQPFAIPERPALRLIQPPPPHSDGPTLIP